MSTHTDTNVNNLVINKMTKSIYDSLSSISDTELYFITDDDIYLKANNIKTINGQSLLGSGDLTISTGVTESRVNELIAAYMTANYESGDTKEY